MLIRRFFQHDWKNWKRPTTTLETTRSALKRQTRRLKHHMSSSSSSSSLSKLISITLINLMFVVVLIDASVPASRRLDDNASASLTRRGLLAPIVLVDHDTNTLATNYSNMTTTTAMTLPRAVTVVARMGSAGKNATGRKQMSQQHQNASRRNKTKVTTTTRSTPKPTKAYDYSQVDANSTAEDLTARSRRQLCTKDISSCIIRVTYLLRGQKNSQP